MRVSISKSKNSESFYITKSYCNDNGKSTSKVVRRLGTLSELTEKLGTDRDGVITWAKEQAKLETEKYRDENEMRKILITFRADRQLDYNGRRFYEGGYLFLQSIYYKLKLDKICSKLKKRYQCAFDFNAILSDLIYTKILDFQSNQSFCHGTHKFLESSEYEQKDICSMLHILAKESEAIQQEVYKTSRIMFARNDHILYFGRKKYSLENIQFNDTVMDQWKNTQFNDAARDTWKDMQSNDDADDKKEAECREKAEFRKDVVFQVGMFKDEDNIPLFFFLYPEKRTEQMTASSLLENIVERYGCSNIVYYEDREPFFINTIYRNSIDSGLEVINRDYFRMQDAATRGDCVQAHFLIGFLSLVMIRLLKKQMGNKYTSDEILHTLRAMNFANVEEQGYMPLYTRDEVTDALHEVCGFRTDYQFISKSKMREIQKKSKGRK